MIAHEFDRNYHVALLTPVSTFFTIAPKQAQSLNRDLKQVLNLVSEKKGVYILKER
jgi:hypothetical protein